MKNTELLVILAKLLADINAGTVSVSTARQAINAADKMIKSASLQLEYERTKKSLEQRIQFLEQP